MQAVHELRDSRNIAISLKRMSELSELLDHEVRRYRLSRGEHAKCYSWLSMIRAG